MDAKVEMAIATYEHLLKTTFKGMTDEQKTQAINGILEYTVGMIAGAMGKYANEDEAKWLMQDIFDLIEDLDDISTKGN